MGCVPMRNKIKNIEINDLLSPDSKYGLQKQATNNVYYNLFSQEN